jgi:hypothetical protein
MIHTSSSPEEMMKAMREITLFAQGKKHYRDFEEDFEDLEFSSLLENYRSAEEAAAKTPYDMTARAKMIHAYGLYRDAMFSYCGRKFLQGLGIHNAFRTLYETAKSAKDAGIEED